MSASPEAELEAEVAELEVKAAELEVKAAAQKGAGFLPRWPWFRGPSAKDDHRAELAVLAEGGLAVSVRGAEGDASLAPEGGGGVAAELSDVEVGAAGDYIHTLAIRNGGNGSSTSSSSSTDGKRHSLVMTHGYFTGLGFYFRNYQALSQVPGWDVYAIDWLGMGRSSRPQYASKRAASEDERVAYAEDFFVSSLEAWRERMGIERMTLCGHSFGGYMSALYALRYPERVEKLVLVSPIGVPEEPAGYAETLRQGIGPACSRASPPAGSDATPEYEPPAPKPVGLRVAMFCGLMALWERNYSPQWLVRNTGPLGRRLINTYVGRFEWLTAAQRTALGAYTLQISLLPGSSEAALGDVLRPGAFARRPLVARLDALAVPPVFMYGANDWVDYTGGQQVLRRIPGGPAAGALHRIPNAGHNLHLENPADFNRVLIREMAAISAR
ncbi:hypothetical protein H4R18_005099 [Coemansia javaensis]|uniref:AB hydrolase-1 domain-containing protein n=1 Tax=Coemansia javaensis TaxID=2761396 RepID=A0A9W8H7I1_9FUNG|nr:hypothetical protein H4R18_005099 [Coemansia javaensis]